MLTSEIVADVRAHGFDDLDETVLLVHINDAYFDVCSREPWPFLEASSVLTVDPVTGKVTAPTDIGAVLSISETVSGRSIHPSRLDDFTDAHAAELGKTGDSTHYYMIANDLYVYPIPSTGAFVARYIQVPADLTTTPDTTPLIPKMHHRVITSGALANAAIGEDDPELSAFYTNMFERRIQQMRQSVWMRQYDETDVIQNVDVDDDWWGF